MAEGCDFHSVRRGLLIQDMVRPFSHVSDYPQPIPFNKSLKRGNAWYQCATYLKPNHIFARVLPTAIAIKI